MRLRTILVPLDGTAPALAALPVAGALADIVGAALHVVHVAPDARAPRDMAHELGLAPAQLRTFVLDLVTGRPGEALVRLADETPDCAMVLCTHTRADHPPGTLGRVARDVICGCSCPVVLVQPERGPEPWRLRRMLLPHDGTPATAAAMDPAGDLAQQSGAEILVLHIAEPGPPGPAGPGTLRTPRYMDQPQHEWPAWAAEFLERMTALGHPPAEVHFRLAMATGSAADEIVRTARERQADLIVMAWRGRWEPERALTMRKVIRNASAPVLITRAADEH